MFEVSESNEMARRAVQSYAASLKVSPDAALVSLGISPDAAVTSLRDDTLRFHALALRSDGSPVPVVNSDEGFALLLGHPSPSEIDEAISSVMRPFPAGLLTDAGVVVANPVFAPRDLQERFSNRAYHGTVIWSWQQAMLAAGLERQLRRRDLPATVLKELENAQRRLWQVITAAKSMANSELWTWRYEAGPGAGTRARADAGRRGGKYVIAPFGGSSADADESNAAQLWSTVYLAIWPPGELPEVRERGSTLQ